MLDQEAVSNPTNEDGGLLPPLKAVDCVFPAFRDGVECPFDDGFCLPEGDRLMWLLLSGPLTAFAEECACCNSPDTAVSGDPIHCNSHGVARTVSSCSLSGQTVSSQLTAFCDRLTDCNEGHCSTRAVHLNCSLHIRGSLCWSKK